MQRVGALRYTNRAVCVCRNVTVELLDRHLEAGHGERQ
jgi:hypothetical protein